MIVKQAQEQWRTDRHIEGYEVSNTGKIRTEHGREVAVHGHGARAFVKLVDRKGRQRQKNLWQLVRTVFGHNPIQLADQVGRSEEPMQEPMQQAAAAVQPEPVHEKPVNTDVVWKDITDPEYRSGYRISTLGEVMSYTGEILQGSTVHSLANDPRFTRRIMCMVRAKGSGFTGHKQVRLDHLMAQHFMEPAPGSQYDIEHINGDPDDCRLENLRWGIKPTPPRTPPRRRRKTSIDTLVRNMGQKMSQDSEWAMVQSPRVAYGKYWAHRDGTIKGLHDRPLSIRLQKDGHKSVCVKSSKSGRSTTMRVDHLVLEAFGQMCPGEGYKPLHINGDFDDCALENLRWTKDGADAPPPAPIPVRPVSTANGVRVITLSSYRVGNVEVIVNNGVIEPPKGGTPVEQAAALAQIYAEIARQDGN